MNMNSIIRRAVLSDLALHDPADSRKLIGIMSRRFRVTRQKISGNISWLVLTDAVGLTVIHPGRESILYL